MVRLLYILGISAIAAACGVLVLCLRGPHKEVAHLEAPLDSLGSLQALRESTCRLREDEGERTPPLVKQAEAFAAFLAPARPAKKAEAPAAGQETIGPVPSIRPPAPSVQFKLCGTSYYPNQPKRSMALIRDLGSTEGNERWVKEGTQLGHFIVQEIRAGAIVYHDGENLREMTVEASPSVPSIVRDIRPGTRKTSAVVEGVSPILPIPAGPNSVKMVGGN